MGALRAMPALLMRTSIRKGELLAEKCSRAEAMREDAPAGVLMSAWTGTARMLWVEERRAAREAARSVEAAEV